MRTQVILPELEERLKGLKEDGRMHVIVSFDMLYTREFRKYLKEIGINLRVFSVEGCAHGELSKSHICYLTEEHYIESIEAVR